MPITDWPQKERPRERLLRQGAPSLSDAELLAIYLRTGIRGKNAVELARDLLTRYNGSLSGLANSSVAELSKIPGIGLAKAAQLLASFELARRAIAEDFRKKPLFDSPKATCDWLLLHLGHLPHEVFVALWLDSQNCLIESEEMFRGSLTATSVYPREVVKSALKHNAAGLIIAHNHPSGFCEPSQEDIRLTRQLKEALDLIEVRLLDHFIIAPGKTPLSLAERGEI